MPQLRSQPNPACVLQGIATVGAVDCDVESNKPLCGQYGVQGFPTLKFFPGDKPKSGRKSASDYQGESTQLSVLQQVHPRHSSVPLQCNAGRACNQLWLCATAGPRSAKGIADAATAGLHAKLIQRPANAADFDKFRTGSALPKVVLFTDKPKTTVRITSACASRTPWRPAGFAHIRSIRSASDASCLRQLHHTAHPHSAAISARSSREGNDALYGHPSYLLLLQTLFKSLSMRFRDRLAFAEVRDASSAIASTFGVNSTPVLLVIPTEGEPITYEGEHLI